jgi:heavy metal sensor kinase
MPMHTLQEQFRRFAGIGKRKRLLPLRLRLALWSAGLVLVLSFVLLLFINIVAIKTFPDIIRLQNHALSQAARTRLELLMKRSNPLELALFRELRDTSLMGLGLITIIGGLGAYWLAGAALRPVRKISDAAKTVSANTLDTRLALAGPKDEVKELADTFDAMLERLKHTFELQSNFVADVAHELRTPLASLRTNLEVVSADENATLVDFRAMVETHERAIARLERLVADLLILTTGEHPLATADISLAALLEEVVDDLRVKAEERQVALQLLHDEDVVMRGDSTLLSRALSNLIENALHYNVPGGNVTVTIDHKDRWAVVTVSDSGIGIAPENLPHIFERFYRVDASRSRHNGGAGLGLSIVSSIVQRHGGQLLVESTLGKGSVFTVLLPVSCA